MTSDFAVAGLERRFYAFVLDRALAWSLYAVVGVGAWLLLGAGWVAAIVVAGTVLLGWLVLAVLAGVAGVSPGKSALGLRVVHQETGLPIGVGPALLRALVLAVSGVPTFGIGLATLAWTAVEDGGGRRRGWHDLRARSVVVDVRPVVEVAAEEVEETPRHVVNLTAMRLVPAPAVPAPSVPARTTSAPSVPGPSAPPATRWRVTFDDGTTFVVEGLVLVGRRPEPRHGEQVQHLVPLASADMSVSKTHAQIHPSADGVLVVMDRGSTNGSVLLRQGVSRPLAPGRAATLLDGDEVVVGDRRLTVSREA